MSEFVLNRTHRHISRNGHSIQFIKGEPVFVPPECRSEVIGIGAQPLDGNTDVLDEEKRVVELTAEERQAELIKAFKFLQERNHRTDFTGQGMPSIPALKKIVEFEPDKKEVEHLFTQYREEQAAN